jgi:hypothetical protein
MCESEHPERRQQTPPSSPGLQLLRHLEGLRGAAETVGVEHAADELNLPAICVELGLAGLVAWRAEHDANHTAWQLDSRETLVWHGGAARLWSCWSSVDWLQWTRQAEDAADADPD